MLPPRNDRGGITSEHPHVDEAHLVGLRTEGIAKPGRVLIDHRHHHGLAQL
jgi:hypothetical protein